MPLPKPVSPILQPGHPLGNGLKFFLPAHGPADVGSARDCVGGLNLTANGSARTGQGGLVCDATGKGFQATIPASLKFALPITIACQVRILGTPTASASLFGLIPNTTNATPFVSAGIQVSGTNFLALSTNNNGTFVNVDSAVTPASRVGFRDILVGVLTATSRTLYLNGAVIASASGSYLSPTYAATALVAAGNYTGISRNSNCVVEGGAAWNRALSLAEIQGLTADFFAPVRPRSALAVLAATLPPPAAFQAAWAASSNQFIGGGY